MKVLKRIVKKSINYLGYELYPSGFLGTDKRPVGVMRTFLEDLRARGLRCNWILDVGANCGDWSRLATSIFKSSRCFLIEPQEEMVSSIERFCIENPGSGWILAGAGPKNGQMALTVWDDLLGSSFLPGQEDTGNNQLQQRVVSVVTIDYLIESGKLAIPDLVKLDVQGFELDALRGAGKLFGQSQVFILETSLFKFMPGMPTLSEVVLFMSERGYVVYDFAGFLRRPFDGALGQTDICFVLENGIFHNSNRWD